MVKGRILKIVQLQVFLTVLFLLCSVSALLASQNDEKAQTAKLKKQAIEIYESLKSFTLEQKHEALTAAEEKLDQLDEDIDEIEKDLYEKWQELGVQSREQKQMALKTLRKKRKEVAEWYGGLKHGSAETWDEVKKGLTDSMVRLNEAIGQVGKKVLTEKLEEAEEQKK